MARVEEYRKLVQDLIREYAQQRPMAEEVETEIIFDTERDHYQLVNVGWLNNRRIYGCVLHIDIKGDKVWIQHNGTELPVAEELVALGIPQDSIVLGFHAPYKRQFTEFAVN
jgi:hypothetical protein